MAPEGRRVCSNDGLNGKGGGELAQSLTYFFAEPPPRPHLLFPPKCFLGVCINARVIHPRIKHFAVYQIFDALYSPPLRATNQLGMAFLSAADFLGQRLETPIQVHIPPMAAIRSGAFSSRGRCILRWNLLIILVLNHLTKRNTRRSDKHTADVLLCTRGKPLRTETARSSACAESIAPLQHSYC